ncbi:MAG: hypothetical protein GQ542_10645 [Desulforhopalus sp.]|jgi:signal transduction histidine kinase|nr:hypothetical protein [Desulforhopalus sp.]
MESMTEDMLDFSKPLTLNWIRGSFNTTVQDALSKVKEASERNNVAIEYRSNPDVMDISFDPLWLEQVLVNLVQCY